MRDQCLRPSERLRHQHEYQRVFQYGTKQVAPAFVLYMLPTSEPYSRLGITVSKRVGGAVIRNRVKRRTREFFRHHKMTLQQPCDLVVVARRAAAEVSYAESTRQFLTLLYRCQRLQEKECLRPRVEQRQG
jgi:ribonuclease P protein component